MVHYIIYYTILRYVGRNATKCYEAVIRPLYLLTITMSAFFFFKVNFLI